MMNTFTLESLDMSINITKTKYSNYLLNDDFIDIKNRISLLLVNEEFINMIDNATYFKEQELIYNKELKIIDLLIQKESKVIIIDYKTTVAVQDSHIKQVSYYRSAIQNITSDCDIECFVVYLHKENIQLVSV